MDEHRLAKNPERNASRTVVIANVPGRNETTTVLIAHVPGRNTSWAVVIAHVPGRNETTTVEITFLSRPDGLVQILEGFTPPRIRSREGAP